MPPQDLDFDLDRDGDGDGGFRAPPLHRTKLKKGFFTFENPGFVLVLWNFFLALLLSYILTCLNKQVISYVGYEKIMCCPCGILFSRFLFVAVNMWLVVGWGWQLNVEARERKMARVERVKEEAEWWERECRRLEGVREGVLQREVGDQILRESPTSVGTGASAKFNTNGNSNGKSNTVPPVGHRAAAKQADEDGYEVESSEDEEESEESSEDGDDRDSEWNGVD